MTLEQVKPNFYKKVKYENMEYKLTECIMWYDKRERKLKYSISLLDIKSNSIVRAPLERVEIISG